MADRKIDVQFNLIDNFTSSFQNTISVLTSGTKAAQRAWRGVEKAGESVTRIGSNLTKSLTLPIAGMGTVAVAKFSDVDKTMQLTNATMQNTAEEAQMLQEAMEAAAMASTLDMADAADATLNFARAGLNAAEAADALAPAMNLATGEGGDLNTVSAGLVGTINGFHDSFSETAHYADVFAAACNNSALDINSLSESFSVAAPIFATAGMSVEDAALYMGTMANNGIDANVAATSLKTGLARLVSPAKDAQKVMSNLGISVTNADGSFKDSVTIQEELHDAFAGLSESEQMAAAATIFGKNQMSAWLALINTSPESVGELDDSLRNCTGTTQEMADAMMGGFGGSLEQLSSSIDVLMAQLGEIAAEYLTPLIQRAQELVDAFVALDPEVKKQIVRWGLIAAAVGPALLVFGKMVATIGSIGGGLTKAAIFISKAATGFKGLTAATTAARAGVAAFTSPIGIVAAAVAALAVVVISVATHFDTFKAAVNGATGGIGTLSARFSSVAAAGQSLLTALSPLIDFLGNAIAAAAGIAVGAFLNVASGILTMVSGAMQELSGLINFITGVFTGDWEKAWNGVQTIFSGVFDIINGMIQTLTGALSGIIGGLKELFGFDGKSVNVNANVTETKTSSGSSGGGGGKKFTASGRASGDYSWTGGIVQVHERGGEIIDLPHGTRIYPHDESVQMARAEGLKINIPKLAETIIVREEADIDRIADRIARRIQAAANNMGGVSVANMA